MSMDNFGLWNFPPRLLAVSERCPQAMLNRDQWSIKDFVLVKEVGSGAASTVYYALCRKSTQPVAIKMYLKAKLSKLNRRQVEREINIHSSLNHPHIIDFYAAFEDAERIYLVQEYAAGGDLFDDVKRRGGRVPEREVVQQVLYPYLQALAYLHARGIIHRDIKPENTVFTRERVMKVTDFGLAINSVTERPVTRLGTLDYMAPEVLRCPDKHAPDDNKDRVDLEYDAGVDAWAMGVLAYELVVGRPPFGMSCREATMRAIVAASPSIPDWMSHAAADFIRSALQRTAARRSAITQLLEHPWITAHTRSMPHAAAVPCGVESGRGPFYAPQPVLGTATSVRAVLGGGVEVSASSATAPRSLFHAGGPYQHLFSQAVHPNSASASEMGGGGGGMGPASTGGGPVAAAIAYGSDQRPAKRQVQRCQSAYLEGGPGGAMAAAAGGGAGAGGAQVRVQDTSYWMTDGDGFSYDPLGDLASVEGRTALELYSQLQAAAGGGGGDVAMGGESLMEQYQHQHQAAAQQAYQQSVMQQRQQDAQQGYAAQQQPMLQQHLYGPAGSGLQGGQHGQAHGQGGQGQARPAHLQSVSGESTGGPASGNVETLGPSLTAADYYRQHLEDLRSAWEGGRPPGTGPRGSRGHSRSFTARATGRSGSSTGGFAGPPPAGCAAADGGAGASGRASPLAGTGRVLRNGSSTGSGSVKRRTPDTHDWDLPPPPGLLSTTSHPLHLQVGQLGSPMARSSDAFVTASGGAAAFYLGAAAASAAGGGGCAASDPAGQASMPSAPASSSYGYEAAAGLPSGGGMGGGIGQGAGAGGGGGPGNPGSAPTHMLPTAAALAAAGLGTALSPLHVQLGGGSFTSHGSLGLRPSRLSRAIRRQDSSGLVDPADGASGGNSDGSGCSGGPLLTSPMARCSGASAAMMAFDQLTLMPPVQGSAGGGSIGGNGGGGSYPGVPGGGNGGGGCGPMYSTADSQHPDGGAAAGGQNPWDAGLGGGGGMDGHHDAAEAAAAAAAGGGGVPSAAKSDSSNGSLSGGSTFTLASVPNMRSGGSVSSMGFSPYTTGGGAGGGGGACYAPGGAARPPSGGIPGLPAGSSNPAMAGLRVALPGQQGSQQGHQQQGHQQQGHQQGGHQQGGHQQGYAGQGGGSGGAAAAGSPQVRSHPISSPLITPWATPLNSPGARYLSRGGGGGGSAPQVLLTPQGSLQQQHAAMQQFWQQQQQLAAQHGGGIMPGASGGLQGAGTAGSSCPPLLDLMDADCLLPTLDADLAAATAQHAQHTQQLLYAQAAAAQQAQQQAQMAHSGQQGQGQGHHQPPYRTSHGSVGSQGYLPNPQQLHPAPSASHNPFSQAQAGLRASSLSSAPASFDSPTDWPMTGALDPACYRTPGGYTLSAGGVAAGGGGGGRSMSMQMDDGGGSGGAALLVDGSLSLSLSSLPGSSRGSGHLALGQAMAAAQHAQQQGYQAAAQHAQQAQYGRSNSGYLDRSLSAGPGLGLGPPDPANPQACLAPGPPPSRPAPLPHGLQSYHASLHPALSGAAGPGGAGTAGGLGLNPQEERWAATWAAAAAGLAPPPLNAAPLPPRGQTTPGTVGSGSLHGGMGLGGAGQGGGSLGPSPLSRSSSGHVGGGGAPAHTHTPSPLGRDQPGQQARAAAMQQHLRTKSYNKFQLEQFAAQAAAMAAGGSGGGSSSAGQLMSPVGGGSISGLFSAAGAGSGSLFDAGGGAATPGGAGGAGFASGLRPGVQVPGGPSGLGLGSGAGASAHGGHPSGAAAPLLRMSGPGLPSGGVGGGERGSLLGRHTPALPSPLGLRSSSSRPSTGSSEDTAHSGGQGGSGGTAPGRGRESMVESR